MTRRPEDITLSATASGVVLALAAAALLIIYAIFTGVGLASPAVSANLSRIGF